MLVDDVIDAVTNFMRDKETFERLETRVVRPCLDYISDRVTWNLRLFWLMVALAVVQTAMLAFLVAKVTNR